MRLDYDRRRELADMVEFMNEECGTSVEIPANFKPKVNMRFGCYFFSKQKVQFVAL